MRAERKRIRKAPEVRRAEIMDAAAGLFLARGYQSTTVDDIVREAGVGKGTFYLYFDSKPQVLAAAAERIQLEMIEGMQVLASSRRSAQTRLYLLLVEAIESYRKNEDLIVLFHMAAPETAHERMESRGLGIFRAMLKDVIEEGVEDGSFLVEDLEGTVEFILVMLESFSHHVIRPDSALSIETAVKLGKRVLDALLGVAGETGRG